MHVCCIGKFNIPVFTRKIHFPFHSNKEKSEGGGGQLVLKACRLVKKPFHCVDEDINGVCGPFVRVCVWFCRFVDILTLPDDLCARF